MIANLKSNGRSVDVDLLYTVEKGQIVYADGLLGIAAGDGESGDEIALLYDEREYQFEVPASLSVNKGNVVYADTGDVTGHYPDDTAYNTSGIGTALFIATSDKDANDIVTGILIRPSGANSGEFLSGARVKRGSPQTITSGSVTAADYTTAVFDTDDYFDIGNPARLTIPADGIYVVSGFSLWQINATGIRYGRLYHFDLSASQNIIVSYTAGPATGFTSEAQGLAYSAVIQAEAGDFVHVQVFHDSGANRTVSPELSIARIA